MGIFKANDIRGIFPDELDRDTIYSIGYHLPSVLNADKILIGRDIRTSSDEIFNILSMGITDRGADVVDIGLCDTPAVYFATAHFDFKGSVMITASHNPAEYNGLKISRSEAIPVGSDTGLAELEKLIKTKVKNVTSKGKITFLDISMEYKRHIQKYISDFTGIKAIFDCGNGAAATFIHTVFSDNGLDYITLFDKPDGTFPNHGPNPLEKKNWASIQNEIKNQKADIGVIFDGDADRAIFFDEKGSFISPDIITALIGNYYYGQYSEGSADQSSMYYDIRSSRSVSEYIENLGGKALPCTTGHANIKRVLRETKGAYAGELSGHYYFKENYYCDSGFIAAAVVIKIIKKINRPLSVICSSINPYFFSGEINFIVNNQALILEKIPEYFPEGKLTTLDGVRIDFEKWWFIIRPSGAEAILRLVVEADNRKLMDKRIIEIKNIIILIDKNKF